MDINSGFRYCPDLFMTLQMKNRTLPITVTALMLVVLGCWNGGTNRRSSTSDGQNISHTPDIKNENTSVTNANVNTMDKKTDAVGFRANLPDGFRNPSDDAGKLLLKEYGSVFVARGGVTPPKTVVFKDQAEVSAFQSALKTSSETVGSFSLELQSAAMDGLQKAIGDAKNTGLSITPRDKDSAKRSYDETIELWNSRVDPALKHWVAFLPVQLLAVY